MAEGGIDPFEIRPVDPDETTDETTDYVTPDVSPSTSREFNTGETSSTPMKNTDGKKRNELKEGKIEDFYKYLGVKGDINLVKLDKFRTETHTKLNNVTNLFFYKDWDLEWVQLTNICNGEFLAKSTLKNRFGGREAMKKILGIIENITPEQAAELNQVNNNLPSTSYINNASAIELQNIANRVNKSIEDIINMVREIDESGLTLQELNTYAKDSASKSGHIRDLAEKMANKSKDIKKQQEKLDYIQNSTEYNEEEKQHRIKEIKDTIEKYEGERDKLQESINNFKYELKCQINSIKETINKIPNSDMTLG